MIKLSDFKEPIRRTIGDVRRNVPWLRWNLGYALTQMSRSGVHPRIVTLHPEDPAHADLQDLVVYVDSDGGQIDLLGWWTQQVEQHDMVVAIDGGNARTPLWVRLHRAPPEAGADTGIMDDVAAAERHPVVRFLDLFFASAASNREAALAHLRAAVAAAAPSRLHLLIRDLEAMGSGVKVVSGLLSSFRDSESMRQKPTASSLVVVIGCRFEMSFDEDLRDSGYQRICRVFRLPSLTAHDVAALARWYRDGVVEVPSLSEQEVEEWQIAVDGTGGQPELVHDTLRAWAKGGFTLSTLRSVLADLRDSPPSYTRRWSENLRKLVHHTPAIARRMEECLKGDTEPDEKSAELDLALCCCGWLDINAAGQWCIRSPVHRSLARGVLDALKVSHGR